MIRRQILPNAQVTDLLALAHDDRGKAFELYAAFEFAQNGDVEWSDLHQLSTYPAGYHVQIDRSLHARSRGADLISEMYVPREKLVTYIEEARKVLMQSGAFLVYGTVRFIEQDRDTFLAWAKQRYACVIFTIHTSGQRADVDKYAGALPALGAICAIAVEGSFYLTYQQFAMRRELDGAYPQFAAFLQSKRESDPDELFQSDWYRHYKALYR